VVFVHAEGQKAQLVIGVSNYEFVAELGFDMGRLLDLDVSLLCSLCLPEGMQECLVRLLGLSSGLRDYA
jgi:hypothetical protein